MFVRSEGGGGGAGGRGVGLKWLCCSLKVYQFKFCCKSKIEIYVPMFITKQSISYPTLFFMALVELHKLLEL